MSTPYLIYCYGQDGFVRSSAHATCADENDAIFAAWHEMRPDDSRGEIWQGQRRIFLILGDGGKAM